MRMLRKAGILVLSAAMLCACSSSKTTTKEKTSSVVSTTDSLTGDYYRIVNMGRNPKSEDIYTEFSTSNDFVTIGNGLQELSQDHFSTSDYYLSEGQQLSLSDYNKLMKRDAANATKKNFDKTTLQPTHGTTIDGIVDPVMVTNMTEQDFFTKNATSYTLKGASIAVILNPQDANNNDIDTMSKDAIEDYCKKCASRLYKYIRENKKTLKDLPILIAFYMKNDSAVSLTNGNYIYQAFCENGEVGALKAVNHETVTFTSTRASTLDPATSSEFETIKAALKNASTEAASIVGEATYVNNTIQTMKITAYLNVKSYTEMLYLTSVLADQIDSKFTQDFQTKVLVYSQDELMAVIIKNKGSDAKTTIIQD